MDTLDKLRVNGTKIHLNVEGNDVELTYYFPRVPSIGEYVRILNSDGQKNHGLEETLCEVVEVHYSILEGKHSKSGVVTEETHGWVPSVLVIVRPRGRSKGKPKS